METSLLSILALGLVYGIKHALEPDHIMAVSTIASRSKKLWRSALLGVHWGIGHTLTLFVMGMIIILMKGKLEEKWAMSLEFLVGIMLVYLGLSSIFAYRKKKIHVHLHEHDGLIHSHFHAQEQSGSCNHQDKDVSYIKSMIIGFVHGLAGSAAMVLLTMSTVTKAWEGALYILIFGLGTVIGMLVFTTLIGIPFVFSRGKASLNDMLVRITGVVSAAFGLYYMYNLGVTEGLFELWM